MTDKALISSLTWRSLEMQKAAFPDMPCFIAPNEIPTLLRDSTRNGELNIHVMSLAVIADQEKDFIEFLKLVRARKALIKSKEEDLVIGSTNSSKVFNGWVKKWKAARMNGAAKVGGRISADLRKKKSAEGAARIRARWPLPSSEWPTPVLLMEAEMSLNTAKSILGNRPIAQANYRAKMKRQKLKEERANA